MVSQVFVDLSRSFPTAMFVWRRRKTVAIVIVVVVVVAGLLYTVPEVIYVTRANAVLAAIEAEQSERGMVVLQSLCPKVKNYFDGPVRVCSAGDVLHPYHEIIAWSELEKHTNRQFGVNMLLPRHRVEPLELIVIRDVSSEGEQARVRSLPNSNYPKGVVLYLQKNAIFHLRLKYRCSLPFVTCVSYSDLLSGD